MALGSGSGGFRLREWLKTSLTAVPGAIVLLAIALSAVTVRLDDATTRGFLGSVFPVGSASSAADLLAAIASAVVTLLALVFSITMLVLQLSSSQFSPRVLRTFLRDRTAQVALGVLAGTFVYSLLVLRALDSGEEETAPPMSVAVAALLALASLAVFVNFISHIAHKIRISSILRSITDEAATTISDLRRGDRDDEPVVPEIARPPVQTVSSPHHGYVVSVAADGLVHLAGEADAVIVVVPQVGDFVTTGSPLLKVYGPTAVPAKKAARMVSLGAERTVEQDIAFAFRQLVDVVERSMSPALNDTTTAVQSVEHLRELLRALASTPIPTAQRRGEDGEVRLVVQPRAWEDYVCLAVDEVIEVGRGSRRIRLAVERMLRDASSVAPPDRRDLLLDRLRAISSPKAG